MRYPRCRAENRQGRRSCAECGASLALACPACGFSNEPGERFCGGCGAPIRSSPTVAQPKFGAPESYTPRHLADKILTSKSALEGERKQGRRLEIDWLAGTVSWLGQAAGIETSFHRIALGVLKPQTPAPPETARTG